MSDKCSDSHCRATVTYPKKWRTVKGKNIEVVSGRCPDCGTSYMKSREIGTTEPVKVKVSATAM